jgi:hypothetical protein
MPVETLFALGGLALALVALNVVLQRLARPDQGNERIAGCCGMALPKQIMDDSARPKENHEH